MSLDAATLKSKWWFTAIILISTYATKAWVLHSAGVDDHGADFISAITLLELLVLLGLWYVYSGLIQFIILRIWPALTRRLTFAKQR